MAKFVIAGRADCPRFARAEMLADTLKGMLPDMNVHKVLQSPEEWPGWLQDQCSANGWSHSSSPLVWRELLDRGGKGLYLGGLEQFQDYAQHYYGLSPDTELATEEKIASENMDSLISVRLEQQSAPRPTVLCVCITNAASQLAYHLASLVATGKVFGEDTLVQLQLLASAEEESQLEGVAMELADLASPCLAGVLTTSSAKKAFNSVSAAFILDFPRTAPGCKEEDTEVAESTSRSTPLSSAALLYSRYASTMDFSADKGIRVVVAGQFANVGAAVMSRSVTSIPKENFVASSALPEQQARSIIAQRLQLNSSDVIQVAIWGRTKGESVLADISQTRVRHFQGAITGPDPFSLPLSKCEFEREWLGGEFPRLLAARHGKREGYREGGVCSGVELAEAVGLAGLMAEWNQGKDENSSSVWRSVGVVSPGDYDVPEGVAFSVPARCEGGKWKVVRGLEVSADMQTQISQQAKFLQQEIGSAMAAIEEQKQS